MIEPFSPQVILRFHRIALEELSSRGARLHMPSRACRIHAFYLDADSEVGSRCEQWLSQSERERAERLRFAHDRYHYVVAHGYLRYILGRYCGLEPEVLEFHAREGGKPALFEHGGQPSRFTYSLSHSHGCGLVAVAEGFEVGVDLEQVRDDVDHLTLAQRFFSAAESDAIRSQPKEAQQTAFFRHWVGKEAVLKAKGTGLHFPLKACELVFRATEDRASVRGGLAAENEHRWDVRFLPLEAGWVGAVAAEGVGWMVTYGS